MDHFYIEEHNIVARYEMGKLSSESRADFEEHLVDCRQCQEQLAATEDFRQGLKTVAAEDIVRQPVVTSASSVWMSSAGRRLTVATFAACVLLIAASGLLLVRERRISDQLSQTRLTAADWQHRYENGVQVTAELQKRINEAEQKGSTVSFASARPFPLSTVRGGDQSGSVNWVMIAKGPQWVFLAPDVEEEYAAGYRATLLDSDGHILWEENHPTSSKKVEVGVPPGILRQGKYVLAVEVRHHSGQSSSYKYPFEVKLKK